MVKIFNSLALIFFIAAVINAGKSDYGYFLNEIGRDRLVHKLIEGSTQFSLDLLRTLNADQSTDRDLFFSPHSVWSALVTTYMGARGSTRQEMRKVLGVGDSSKAVTWRAFQSIRYSNAHQQLDDSNFNSVNKIYLQTGTTLKKYIRKMLYDNVAYVDFQNRADEAINIINGWVERLTHRRIRNLIPPHSIDRMTKMVIANAVYFKEEWLQPFEPQNTTRRMFTVSPRQTIPVTMMSTRGMFLHSESKQLRCSILEIPYTDNSLSMIILLPNNKYAGIDYLVNNLNPETLKNLHESMLPKDVFVSIPKFKVEDTYELSAALKKMGLKTLFDSRRVNLSGFTGRRELRLDSVRHKTLIDVNEIGTEAAAATDMFFFRSAGFSKRTTFIADHPFIYYIQDNISNAILFLGTIKKPPEFGRHQ